MAQGSSNSSPVYVTSLTPSPAIIVAAKAGYAIRVLGYVLVATSGAGGGGFLGTVTWDDDSPGTNTLSGPMGMQDSVPLITPGAPPTGEDLGGYFQTASGFNLVIIWSGSGVLGGHVSWCYVAQ